MVAFKRCFLAFVVLAFSAGPTTLAIHAAGHHHPITHGRIAHNRRNLCRPRLSNSSQVPDISETVAVNGTAAHVEPIPDYSTPSSSPNSNSDTEPPTSTAPAATSLPDTDHTPSSFSSSSPRVLATSATTTATESSSQLDLLIPNGIKAGVAGGDAYNIIRDHIGWWYDWSANPSKPGEPIAVPMLWGSGHADATDAQRLKQFQRLSSSSSNGRHPKYVLGYEEPDCKSGGGSSGMGVDEGVREWEGLIAPLKRRGTKIGSPSMCKQADETWLKEFAGKISTPWDFTAIHVNKNNLDGVKKDIDHYWKAYGKPIWVTEFACVNDHNTFTPCTNQQQINSFIHQVVNYFEHDSRVYAYAFSNGEGLGEVWPMMRNGVFSESGKAYLDAISKYH